MRAAIYKGMLALPFKLGAATSAVVGFIGSVWPEKLRMLIGQEITADDIRLAGIILLGVGTLYFVILWLLKPGAGNEAVPTQTNHGPHSANIRDNYGTVVLGPPPPAAAQPAKSPHGSAVWTTEKLHGLERALGARPARDDIKPDLPLSGVLVRLYRMYGPPPAEQDQRAEFDRKIDLAIADAVSQNELHVWGRIGRTPLRLIHRTVWNRGSVSHRHECFGARNPDTGSADWYLDLTFNKAEIERIWPEPLRTTNDGRP